MPHALPSEAEWGTLVHDMPLRLLRYTDEPQLYIALLQVGWATRGRVGSSARQQAVKEIQALVLACTSK